MKRIIRRRELCQLTGLSYSTIFRLIKRGDFPYAVALGAQAIGWYADEVETWLKARRRQVPTGTRGAAGELSSK